MSRDDRQNAVMPWWQRLLWAVAVLAVGALAALSVWRTAGEYRRQEAAGVPVARSAAAASQAVFADGGSAAAALPPVLAGSSAPRLGVDARGNLIRSAGVREFFDYFLLAQHQVDAATLDRFVQREIALQLGATSHAAGEARRLWTQYRAYLTAIDQLRPPAAATTANAASGLDLAALQWTLDQRAALATQYLGEWAEPFFGAQARQQRFGLTQLRIANDSSLSDAEKKRRLAELEQTLPAEQREALDRQRRQSEATDALQNMLQSGASPEAMRAAAAQQFGPAAAERMAKTAAAEQAWHQRYNEYAAQRAQIVSQNLAPSDQQTQIDALRQRYFPNPADALRAKSLDGG